MNMKLSVFGIFGLLLATSLIDDVLSFNQHLFQNVRSRRNASINIQRVVADAVQKQRTTFAVNTVQRTTNTATTQLFSARSSSSSSTKQELDVDALVKYVGAITIQLGLIFGIFTSLDWLVTHFKMKIPFAINFVLFYFLALKSRILNPLANTRPKPSTLEIEPATDEKETTTIRPSWTPPGFIFPIMWLLIIGPIRAVTSAMVYTTTGSYACLPIMSLVLHLSIGDVWNTINNVERRYGASVIGVLLVWLTKAHAAYQYFQVNTRAGRILAITLVWLTIASTLITRTWQLNPDSATNKPEPLYPVKREKVKTRYIWFQKE